MTISLLTYQKIFDEIIVNRDKKKIVHSACQILFAYTSAVPLKLEDKQSRTMTKKWMILLPHLI